MKSLISFSELKLDSITTYVDFKLPCNNHGSFEYLLGIPYNSRFNRNPCLYCSKYGEDCRGFSNELVISLYAMYLKFYKEEVLGV
jgi:hypothetical protein